MATNTIVIDGTPYYGVATKKEILEKAGQSNYSGAIMPTITADRCPVKSVINIAIASKLNASIKDQGYSADQLICYKDIVPTGDIPEYIEVTIYLLDSDTQTNVDEIGVGRVNSNGLVEMNMLRYKAVYGGSGTRESVEHKIDLCKYGFYMRAYDNQQQVNKLIIVSSDDIPFFYFILGAYSYNDENDIDTAINNPYYFSGPYLMCAGNTVFINDTIKPDPEEWEDPNNGNTYHYTVVTGAPI